MGRSSFSGPVAGAYIVPTFHVDDIGVETTILRWKAPVACKAVEFSAVADAHTGGTYTLRNETQAVDMIANRAFAAADTYETARATGTTPALANRSINRGDIISFTVAASTSAEGVSAALTCYTQGHLAELTDD